MPLSFFTSTNSFKGQLPDEKTVLISQKHWITLTGPVIFLWFFIFLPFLVKRFIENTSWYSNFSGCFWFLTTVYFFALWLVFFYNLMIYLLNTVIITNKRVIKREQIGFFRYSHSETEINKIQDISVKIKGPLATLLNWGDLEIQTAGSLNKFNFRTLPSPEKIKKIILEQPR